MSPATFRVHHIDHVELVVPDPYAAAGWHAAVFGLQILEEYERWAAEGGPLMISSDNGTTLLALFRGRPETQSNVANFRRVAFRVDGPGFVHFLQRLADVAVYQDGRRVSPQDVVDHDLSWSIYFHDPDGYRYEVTTYDYEFVAQYVRPQ